MGKDSTANITEVRDRPFNDRRYFVDCSKLAALGWLESKSWLEGLVRRCFELCYRHLRLFY